jgi:hypothetical protein
VELINTLTKEEAERRYKEFVDGVDIDARKVYYQYVG